ncbi:MAG: orotate phosphoribosyltransferase [Patescibacteria group bacterium]
MNNETAQKIAKALLDCGAFKISLDPLFTWTSGIKSPVYCDLRALISHVEIRDLVTEAFVEQVKGMDVEVIAGTATAGIPWAAFLADRLKKPMIYVRSEAKEHGTKKRVEGALKSGQKVLLIEDHISTGKSSVSALNALREEGAQVDTILAINSYELKEADQVFDAAGAKVQTLCNYSVILQVTMEKGLINEEQHQLLQEFRKSPKEWAGRG